VLIKISAGTKMAVSWHKTQRMEHGAWNVGRRVGYVTIEEVIKTRFTARSSL